MIKEAPPARRTVAVSVVDDGLSRAIRSALAGSGGLVLTPEPSMARVLITDGPVPVDPPVPVVLVSDEEPGEGVAVLPPDDPELVVAAAYLLASGYRVLRGTARRATSAGVDEAHLTPRERQVLDLLVSGASNKHIANALDISPHTAKFHVTAVLDKLGARNRSDAVGIALRDGHVTL